MVTPEINENCHYVQNDPHRYKIKLEKFHFDIFCCFGESPRGAESAHSGEIGLRNVLSFTHMDLFLNIAF